MHPILFKVPLPSFNLRYVWIPLVIAAIAALIAAAKMLGKEKDRQGALIAGGVAVVAVIARFTVMKDNTESWNVGNIPIYSYGVMLGLSLVVGWYLTLGLVARDARAVYPGSDEATLARLSKYKETMANNYVVTAIAAVAGARILYILTNLSEFDSFASFFAMRRGGLVAYGGFLGGLAGSFFFLRSHKISLLPWADEAVPSLASGLMITRIGCYLFGCDFGQPLKEGAPEWLKKLGTFPHWPEGTLDQGQGSPAWVQHVRDRGLSHTSTASLPVHPTQLYESLVGAMLLVLLLWARKKQKFRGEIFFLFAFAYGVCRYLLEILRDDAERGSIPPSLPEHILLPLGLGILAVGWVIGFSKAIENVTLRRVTQVLAFVPVVALYLRLKPDTFASAANQQFSTSQFIAFTSGLAASMAFAVFYKASQAHPRQAMELAIPGEPVPEGMAPSADDGDDDEDEEEAPVRRPPPKKTKKKLKAKKGAPKVEEAAEEEGEEAPVARKEEREGDKSGEGDGDPDPVKAS
jgi:phosphatidylglycerol:prolipoprotein diacylglycerol transferase